MIARSDPVQLAPGVRLHGTELVDEVRGESFALNSTAAIALHESTPERMARVLCERHDVDRERAVEDARALCSTLNSVLLVNLNVSTLRLLVRWLSLAVALASVRRLPSWPPRRYAVRTRSTPAAFATAARGALRAAASVGALTGVPLVLVGAPLIGFVVGAAAAAGLVLHEAAHAAALRGRNAALIVRGVRVAVLHRKLSDRREAAVAAAGPLAVVLASLSVLAAAYLTAAAAATPAALVLSLHAFGLTALTPDGRKICVAC